MGCPSVTDLGRGIPVKKLVAEDPRARSSEPSPKEGLELRTHTPGIPEPLRRHQELKGLKHLPCLNPVVALKQSVLRISGH